jgi:hypothetical protein
MASGIFLIKDGKLTEMVQQQPEKEKVLQDLLANHPSLLSGGQMDPGAPRRFVLIGREVGLGSEEGGPPRWSVDHLFLDQDAIPTLVEVKRSSDTRIRREVVGQLIEYAANGVTYWPIDQVRAEFEAWCDASGVDSADRLRDALGGLDDIEAFWRSAKENLESGRVRMVFVGDIIPPELQRMVEFLNEQMSKAEVLAVELRYYRADDLTTLVPRVVGATAKAQERKGRTLPLQAKLDAFVEHVRSRHGEKAALAATHIMEWSRDQQLMRSAEISGERFYFWPGLHAGGASYWPVNLRPDELVISFQALSKRMPFSEESLRRQLLDKLNDLSRVSLPLSSLTGRATISIGLLEDDELLQRILSALTWMMHQIREWAETAASGSGAAESD